MVDDFVRWCERRGKTLTTGQRGLAAEVLSAVRINGMAGRGAGKTFVLRELDAYLADHPWTPATITTSIRCCARCHRDHDDVEFSELLHPVVVQEYTFTHWARCPTNGDPVLLITTEIAAGRDG